MAGPLIEPSIAGFGAARSRCAPWHMAEGTGDDIMAGLGRLLLSLCAVALVAALGQCVVRIVELLLL